MVSVYLLKSRLGYAVKVFGRYLVGRKVKPE